METVSIKFDENFLRVIEKIMKQNNYSTKTEFIREAIRDKIDDLEKKEALKRLEKAYGAGLKMHKRVITDEDLHRAREEAALELIKELGSESD